MAVPSNTGTSCPSSKLLRSHCISKRVPKAAAFDPALKSASTTDFLLLFQCTLEWALLPVMHRWPARGFLAKEILLKRFCLERTICIYTSSPQPSCKSGAGIEFSSSRSTITRPRAIEGTNKLDFCQRQRHGSPSTNWSYQLAERGGMCTSAQPACR